jgi:hypothetical protein
MSVWGADKSEQKRHQAVGGIGELRSPDGYKVIRLEGAGSVFAAGCDAVGVNPRHHTG